VLQVPFHELLTTLERTPAGLHRDWWRSATSLFVQDGGPWGTVSNLGFLLVIGAIVEQLTSRPRWLVAYFGAGLVGELAGYVWQPRGGGNSVAVCGLAGVLAIALLLADPRLVRHSSAVQLYWCAALLGTVAWPFTVVGVGAAMVADQRERSGGSATRPTAMLTLVTAIALTLNQNIHGVALLAGIAIALATLDPSTRPWSPVERRRVSAPVGSSPSSPPASPAPRPRRARQARDPAHPGRRSPRR
jgi:hypothetical protein